MILPLLWALLAGAALAISWAVGAPTLAWAAYLMLGALLIGVAAARLADRGLWAERRLSADRVNLGGKVEVEVTVVNRSRLPVLWVVASEALPPGLPMTGVRGRVGPVMGKGRFRFRYTLEGARRGYYEIGPTIVRTGDLFGLSIRERAAGPHSSLIVYPKMVAIPHARLPSRRSTGESRTRYRVLEDPIRVIGIRPYQSSDGLRRVHWRATAHTGKLQSKLLDPSTQIETAIALNLRRSDYPSASEEAAEAAELAIVAAASVAHHVLDRRQRTSLLAAGRDLAAAAGLQVVRVPADRGQSQLAAILSALGRMTLGPAGDLASALQREKQSLAWGASLVAVTPSVEQTLLGSLLDLRTAGFGVDVVLVGRSPRLAAEQAGLAAIGISASHVRTEADIRGLGI